MGESEWIDLTLRQSADLGQMRAAISRIAAPTGVPAEDAVLAASELVTNALTHSFGACRLQAWNPQPSGPLRIEVRDTMPLALPPALPAKPAAPGGRGLSIVDQLSDRWGVRIHDGLGKTVWFEIDPRR